MTSRPSLERLQCSLAGPLEATGSCETLTQLVHRTTGLLARVLPVLSQAVGADCDTLQQKQSTSNDF